MDEFQKIDEGVDEKGVTGFLLIFIAMMIVFEPILCFIFMYQTGRAFETMPLAGKIFTFCCIGYILVIFFICFSFYKIPKHAVKLAKSFLIIRLFFLTLSVLINFNYTLHDPNAFGPRLYQFYTLPEMVVKTLIIPETYVLLFSLWYIFFGKSKTVKENFGSYC